MPCILHGFFLIIKKPTEVDSFFPAMQEYDKHGYASNYDFVDKCFAIKARFTRDKCFAINFINLSAEGLLSFYRKISP